MTKKVVVRPLGPRIRIVLAPGFVFGPGKADLLAAIGETGSLAKAAKQFAMSYKRAWTLVHEMNDAFAKPLVETEKGGSGGGGGASLTPLGQRIMTCYRQMEADAARAMQGGIADLRRHLKKK